VPQPALVSIADGDTTVSRIERAAGCPRSTLDDRVSLPLAHPIGSTKGVDPRAGGQPLACLVVTKIAQIWEKTNVSIR